MGFCTNCGAPLEEGTRFCTACGAPVVDVGSPTASEPQVSPILPPSAGGTATPRGRRPMPWQNVLAICLAAVIAVGAGVCVVVVWHPWATAATDAPVASSTAAATSPSAATKSSVSAVSATTGKAASTSAVTTTSGDTPASTLDGAYSNIASLDERIRSAAADFNASETAGAATRNASYSAAQAIQKDVSAQASALAGYHSSQNATYLQNLVKLTSDLQHRIDVIVAAWKIDVGYSDPSSHLDEIVSPMVADNDSNGINVYKIDYDNLYPNAKS